MVDKWIKRGGTAGFLGVLAFIVLTLVAFSTYHNYSPFTNYLSDLGLDNIPFNLGCIISGVASIFLANALYRKYDKRAGRIGSVLFLLGSLCLIGVGLFNESTGTTHTVFALLFFLFTAIAIAFLGTVFNNRNLYLLSVITVLVTAAFLPLGFKPLLEHVAVALILLWTLVVSYVIRNQK